MTPPVGRRVVGCQPELGGGAAAGRREREGKAGEAWDSELKSDRGALTRAGLLRVREKCHVLLRF